MARPMFRLCAKLLACTALVCGCTVARAEPLFFDCHGTFDFQAYASPTTPHPEETTGQIMIDLDRDIVEAPVIVKDYPGAGTNKYCSKEPDWQSGDSDQEARRFWKEMACTTLKVSETGYMFNTTYATVTKTVRLSDGQSIESRTRSWSEGNLNRITGKFHGAFEFASKYLYVYDMTCVPAQRKF
jgi:hypothetical protein